MVKLGLLGTNISHSKSQEMYEKILGEPVDYSLLDYAKESDIPSLDMIFDKGFLGLSITYPFKQTFLDQVSISERKVKELNAINCLRKSDDKIEATNTDYLAAEKLIKDFSAENYFVIILGSGNMARVFESCLEGSQYSWMNLSRKVDGDLNEINYLNIHRGLPDKKALLLINCCSRDFIFKADVPSNTVFWDMNYSFPEHENLSGRGMKYLSGLDLLFWQAKFAADYWGIKPL